MKKLLIIALLFLHGNNFLVYSQEVINQKYHPDEPILFIPKIHDPNFLNLRKAPAKSFYESKSDWQRIIDSTWGPGDPLSQKLLIYNTFAQKVHDEFDGFISLHLNWDSLYNHYLNKINDSTSKGAFSSIISHFAYDLKDFHTRAYDKAVILTALNPGVPILLIGSNITVEHFGAVTTVLPDSTTLVLCVVPNHPLNLEPGDIIIGYEGIPWKNLVQELLNAGLPMIAKTGGCKTAVTYQNLVGVGLNWHLFNTIDILKHSTNDTLHLSVLPLLNLNVLPMVNNEQMPIPNIPFPNILADQNVTYGTLENTNVGYIYLAGEWPEAAADAQFYQAVNSLKNTDALIIDMRLNFGGWALFDEAFKILFNDFYKTIEDALRCNINTFELCPDGQWQLYQIEGFGPDFYDRPISVLLGPTCVSMGDLTAQRLRYHPMVRFFGASSDATLGYNISIENFTNWVFYLSVGDMFHTNNPGVYLNRSEFPIDFPVWHNRNNVVMGKDAVVDKALDWINNVVYPHSTFSDKIFYAPAEDTVHLSTIIENPNSHQLSARAYFNTVAGALIDSVNLTKQILGADGGQWTANLSLPSGEEFYKISITAFDQTASTSFAVPNAVRFTTAGPVKLDSIRFLKGITNYYNLRPFVRNEGTSLTISNAKIQLRCSDPWVSGVAGAISFPSIAPGASVGASSWIAVSYYDSIFPGYFNLKAEMNVDGWTYWSDSIRINVITGVEDEAAMPSAFKLAQNFPNPFNPSTIISWRSAVSSWQTLKVFDVLGNEVATLVSEYKPAGSYEVEFSARGGQESGNRNLASGIYFYQLKAGSFVETKKMILLR